MNIRYLKLEPKVPNTNRVTCILVIADDGSDHPPYTGYYMPDDHTGIWRYHMRPADVTDWVYNEKSWQHNDYKITPLSKDDLLIELL